MKKFAKYAIGLFYLFGGPLIHLYCLNFNRQLYMGMADTAWPLYRAVWADVVLP